MIFFSSLQWAEGLGFRVSAQGLGFKGFRKHADEALCDHVLISGGRYSCLLLHEGIIDGLKLGQAAVD